MYPNQQPPQPPQTPPQNSGGFPPQPQPPQPQPQNSNPYAQPSANPQQLPGYGPQPAPTYAVDYLDQIAPPPARGKFLSGSFGKIVIALGVVLVLAVSLIAANSNTGGRTASLENMATRLDTALPIAKNNHRSLKNGKLIATNSNYQIWIANANRDANSLLTQAGVKKSSMDKKMIASEKANGAELTEKFTDAKLNANLDRVYAREMAYQTQLIISAYNKIGKTSGAEAIREYAKKSSADLAPIQKSFSEFDDSIN